MHHPRLTPDPFLRRPGPAPGFTLIEIVVVLAVAVILAVLLAPAAFQALQSSKDETTRKEAERIFTAIVGDPAKENLGYLGDMGRLPATLSELVDQGTQTAFHTGHNGTDHVGRVGTGWRGPYLTGPFPTADLFKDAWGQPLSYTSATSDTPNRAGQIISGGPDGQVDATDPNNLALAVNKDNIIFPLRPGDLPSTASPVRTQGTLVVTVVVNDIPQPIGLTVKVYSTSNGEQGTPVTQTTPSPSDGKPFRFDVPHGVSVIEAIHTASGVTVTRTVNVPVAAGTQVSRTIIMKTSATVTM